MTVCRGWRAVFCILLASLLAFNRVLGGCLLDGTAGYHVVAGEPLRDAWAYLQLDVAIDVEPLIDAGIDGATCADLQIGNEAAFQFDVECHRIIAHNGHILLVREIVLMDEAELTRAASDIIQREELGDVIGLVDRCGGHVFVGAVDQHFDASRFGCDLDGAHIGCQAELLHHAVGPFECDGLCDGVVVGKFSPDAVVSRRQVLEEDRGVALVFVIDVDARFEGDGHDAQAGRDGLELAVDGLGFACGEFDGFTIAFIAFGMDFEGRGSGGDPLDGDRGGSLADSVKHDVGSRRVGIDD